MITAACRYIRNEMVEQQIVENDWTVTLVCNRSEIFTKGSMFTVPSTEAYNRQGYTAQSGFTSLLDCQAGKLDCKPKKTQVLKRLSSE